MCDWRQRIIVGVMLVGAALTACSGGGGSSATTASASPPPAGGSGGDGGSGPGGGGAATSLNTSRFRPVEVAVAPSTGGTVSDNFADFGSAVQDCTSCHERYQIGATVVLTTTPAAGFHFEMWRGGPCDGSAEPACRFVVAQPERVTAIFRR